MPQFGDINAKELNSIGTYCKKVLLYGWDSSALAPVKLLCDSSGNVKIDPTNLDSRYWFHSGIGTDTKNFLTTGTL